MLVFVITIVVGVVDLGVVVFVAVVVLLLLLSRSSSSYHFVKI